MGHSMSERHEMWKVTVNPSLCVRARICAGLAPDSFHTDGISPSRPTREVFSPSDAVLAAAESCPVEAIAIVTERGEQIFPAD